MITASFRFLVYLSCPDDEFPIHIRWCEKPPVGWKRQRINTTWTLTENSCLFFCQRSPNDNLPLVKSTVMKMKWKWNMFHLLFVHCRRGKKGKRTTISSFDPKGKKCLRANKCANKNILPPRPPIIPSVFTSIYPYPFFLLKLHEKRFNQGIRFEANI